MRGSMPFARAALSSMTHRHRGETCNARSPRMTIHHAESTSTAEALLKAQVSDCINTYLVHLSSAVCYVVQSCVTISK